MPEYPEPIDSNDDTGTDESGSQDNLILEEKTNLHCNELKERLVVLTATLNTLKQTLSKQKEQLKEEIKETKEFVQEFKNFSHQVGRLTYDFHQNNKQHQKSSEEAFKEQILEAENMCKVEITKIQNTVDGLIALQSMLAE